MYWEMVTHPHTRKSPLHSRMTISRLRSSCVVRDSDSSSYKKVSTSQPYDDIQVEKLMCSEIVTHPHTRKCPLHSRMAISRLRSSSVLRDGDSSLHKKVSTSQPYGDVNVEKLQCSERW